jgi:hypothetical protein
MSSVRISEQTAIISLHNINWLVFITDGVCLLRGTDWVFVPPLKWPTFVINLKQKQLYFAAAELKSRSRGQHRAA